MNELDSLYNGLVGSSTMLMKEVDRALVCSFLNGGLVKRIVLVKDVTLSAELRKLAGTGILAGEDYYLLLRSFASFSLHVKATKLYLDLRFSLEAEEAGTTKELAA